MSLLPRLLARRRLIVATTLLLALAGLLSWVTMPREEDPQFPERDGLVIVPFPGADAETVERLVVEPVEERLAEVEDILEVYSTSRAGIALVRIELRETVYATDDSWDDVAEAIGRARHDFPAGVAAPTLDHDLVAQEAVVLAVAGSADPLVLAAAAERVKRRLLALEAVRKVNVVGDPEEQIVVEYDDATARRLGIDPQLLGRQLAARSAIIAGGVIHLGSKTANLRPETEFRSLAELAATPVTLPSGNAVPLGELATVRRGPAEPAASRMRWNGEPVVGLGVVPKDDIDRVAFGATLRAELAVLAPSLAPLRVEEVVFQPDQVEHRLDDLSRSLLLGIVIVAGVLFVFMGLRMGLLVAIVVPLVTFGSIALFAAGGGVLNQISIAALVIALGMLVDNAIVVVESIQYRIDRGETKRQAALASVRELAIPLGTATGTTLAAFVPMLVSQGGTADFTRAIPTLILLTLTVSYLFAILVTPVLAELALARRPERATAGLGSLGRRIGELGVRRAKTVLALTAVLLALTAVGATAIDRQFFPAADRAVALLDLEMPEGTHLGRTDEVSRTVEEALAGHPRVRSVAAFVGRAAPHFYYNLRTAPSSPHRAQIVAEVDDLAAVEEVLAWSRDFLARELPEVAAVARRLEQGPPIEAPIEVRLYGHDLGDLETAADAVLAELRAAPGSRDVRHDLGLGVPTVVFEIDDAAAARHGLGRADVARALFGRTLGQEIGQFRAGDDPVPILVRSSAGEELPAADLATIDVAGPGGVTVPLAQVASLDVVWRPAAIHHQARSRVVKVQSQLASGVTFQQVLDTLRPRLAELELPAGVRLAYGGEAEESGAANAAILRAVPLGALLLLFFLLAEFDSFRRVGIVLVTVPLAAVGVVPGLLFSGQPFGFMSLLGVVALVGIVVNNAIVLLDVIETRRGEGLSVEEALIEAVERRTRPILLTMATTVAGLSPLAFSATSLWPPLAWAMISGLAASTVLTLVVVPALYRVLFARRGRRRGVVGVVRRLRARRRWRPAAAAMLAVTLAGGAVARAQEPSGEPLTLGLEEVIARAVERPDAVAAALEATAAADRARATRRSAILPVVAVAADATRRDTDFEIETPLGDFTLGDRASESLAVSVAQPLFVPATRLYGAPAAASLAEAAGRSAERVRQEAVSRAVAAYLDVLAVDAQAAATEAFRASLAARLEETTARVDAGAALEADALKVRLDLESAELDLLTLGERRAVATRALARAVGVDGAVEPRPAPEAASRDVPALAVLVDEAMESRPDLLALDARRRALELRAKEVRAGRLPRLEARGTYSLSDGDPFRPDELAQATVGVVWTPFAAGTRAPQAAALAAEAAALDLRLEEARRGVTLELADARASLVAASAATEVRDRGVELATETLRVETERHAAGRATTNDLLVAEASLRRQRTARDLARLDLLRAWVELGVAAGDVGLAAGSSGSSADVEAAPHGSMVALWHP